MLTRLLIKLFVRNSDKPSVPVVRHTYGMLAGITGIVINVLLCIVKLVSGIVSGSIAVSADAVNNLADAGSSAVTVFGFKLASKPPDSEHPFGHGRMEYVAGLVISVIILATGADFLKEAIGRIFSPAQVDANKVIIMIMACTVLFKVWLFFFYRTIAKRIDSGALHAASFDSLSDTISTFVVIGSLAASRYTSFPVDGCAGALTAVFVMVGGFGIMKDAIDPLVGICPDKDLVKRLEGELMKCRGINGVHDIIMHSYGHDLYFATAHVEVDMQGDRISAHDTLEDAEVEIAKKLPIRLLLHCDPLDMEDTELKVWRIRAENELRNFDPQFKLYDCRIEKNPDGGNGIIFHFHLLTPRTYSLSNEEIRNEIERRLKKYSFDVQVAIDFMHAFV